MINNKISEILNKQEKLNKEFSNLYFPLLEKLRILNTDDIRLLQQEIKALREILEIYENFSDEWNEKIDSEVLLNKNKGDHNE